MTSVVTTAASESRPVGRLSLSQHLGYAGGDVAEVMLLVAGAAASSRVRCCRPGTPVAAPGRRAMP